MTLTHIIPSLRRSIADPVVVDRWPEFTAASPTDITVAGVSLVRLAEWCDTPCVHTAAAVIPGTHGRRSESDLASVLVTRVTAVQQRADGGLEAWLDAELDGCRPLVTEARIIGRCSTAHARAVVLQPSGTSLLAVELPSDLAGGDLLAIPCLGVTTLHDVRQRSGHQRLTDDRFDDGIDHNRDEHSSHCGL
ncbi:hypothetical protein [Lacisediminihabitans changchengi]|uniref:Uncharacterized protein n=1 Tax=Lacisediminihabitans changchengi TaxID=2787634 RepID=A0A934SSL0_9MICO|nr:hypothetical protein [Lacisediminihabitans changchengi]MBK4347369.1 hypothetical protein [Lacisediminihabitans changchengi]